MEQNNFHNWYYSLACKNYLKSIELQQLLKDAMFNRLQYSRAYKRMGTPFKNLAVIIYIACMTNCNFEVFIEIDAKLVF